jgi:uncharacterized membrane protein
MTNQTTSRIAPHWVSPLLWLLAASSVLSHLTSILLHLPQAIAGAMLAGSLMLFGLFHGASTYSWRGIVFFIVLCLGVSNALENLSILTGFPFGWYHYSEKMGPSKPLRCMPVVCPQHPTTFPVIGPSHCSPTHRS